MLRILFLYILTYPTHAWSESSQFGQMVADAQKAAYHILESVEPDDLDVSNLRESIAQEAVRTFYNEVNYHRLLQEAGTSPIVMVKSNENGACGQTQQSEGAKIFLATRRCMLDLTSVAAAARLLLGEYVHHLGHGDEFSDWVKLAVMETFRKNYPEEFRFYSRIQDPFAPEQDVSLRSLLGRVYFGPDAKNPELFMITHQGKLHFTTPKKLSQTVDLIVITQRELRWLPEKKAFHTTGTWHITGYENRYWGQGLYERYPVWFERHFDIEFQVIQSGKGIIMKYAVPLRVDLVNQTVVMKQVTRSFLNEPGEEVIHAFFESNKH